MASTPAVPEAVTRTAIIGCGGMARNHLRSILDDPRGTSIRVVCEPMAGNYELTCEVFEEAGVAVPENVPDLAEMLERHAADLDAVFIVTPHAMHHDHIVASLDAGLDVLVEKPMVVSREEAESVIARRDETGRLVTVAFQGSLSPQIRWASEQLHNGPYGRVMAISGTVWQSWKGLADGRWRLDPHVSGGGFMFDTGAHLMNTIADLAGEDFVEVAAWLNNDGREVDIMAAAMGRLRSGAFVTIHGCGDAVQSCSSTIHVFAEKAHLKACMWGRWVEVQEDGEEDFRRVDLPAMRTAWHRFLDVRAGRIENPSPPEVGLRMLRLWDAINESAGRNGRPVAC